MIDFPITINGNTVYAKELIPLIRQCNSDEAKRIIIEETRCTEKEALEVIEELKVMLKDKSSGRSVLNNKKSTQKIDSRETHQNIPKCPTCQSTNIKKISATSKATNAMLFGLFGNKRKKQFHCNNCGYEW